MGRILSVSAVAIATLLAAISVNGAIAGSSGANTPVTADSPSGLPVPRFVSLRKDEVLARFGPSFDYPVAYEFRQAGLPLKVIAEDRDNIWRRVEDSDGSRMWIHRAMLADNENAVVMSEDTILRTSPDTNARGRARLTKGVITRIEECKGDWCQVRAGEFRGWLPRSQLWGAPITARL